MTPAEPVPEPPGPAPAVAAQHGIGDPVSGIRRPAPRRRVVQIPWRLRDRNLRNRKGFCPALPHVRAFSLLTCAYAAPTLGRPLFRHPSRPTAWWGSFHGAVRSATRSGIARVHQPSVGVGAAGGRPGRRRLRPCPGGPAAHRARPQGRAGSMARRDVRRVPRRGSRPCQGAARAGDPVRGPGRDHVPHALRVDALRLRVVDDRRTGRARLSDLLRRAGLLDAVRRPGVGDHGGARGPRDDDRHGRRPAAAVAQAVAAGRGGRPGAVRGGRAPRRRGGAPAPARGDPGVDRDDHLHLGHHRAPQGLCHLPRELHVRGGHRHRALGAGLPLQAR